MAKILYVEDNEDNVYMLKRRLERTGLEVVVARMVSRGSPLPTISVRI
jgi:two-component system cell cycle response regulator DivK